MAYSKDQIETIFNDICKRISDEKLPIRKVLKLKDMPDAVTFYKWLDSDEDKIKQYARACEERADAIFEEILDIADDSTNDYMTKMISEDLEIEVLNTEHVQRSKLRVDARKWVVSKMNPKKFGDKVDVTSGDKPLSNEIKVDIVKGK